MTEPTRDQQLTSLATNFYHWWLCWQIVAPLILQNAYKVANIFMIHEKFERRGEKFTGCLKTGTYWCNNTGFLVLELGQDPGSVKGQYSPRFSPAIGSIASLLLGVYVELCDEEDERPPVELLVKCIFVRRALDPPSPRPGWNILRTCRTLLDSSWARRTVKEKCGRVAQIVFVFFSSIHLFWRSHEDVDMSHVRTGVWRSRKDIKSLGALCSSVRWAVKSSVTWLGSPPGNAAHMGQIWNKERRECDRHFIISGTTKHELIEKVSRRFINEEIKNCKSNIYWHTATWTLQHLSWAC